MIKVIRTAVIYCDHPDCDLAFFDCVEMTIAQVHRLATKYHGWRARADNSSQEDVKPTLYFCPKHKDA